MTTMLRSAHHIRAVAALLLGWPGVGTAQTRYYPPPGDGWARRSPAEVGLDSIKLAAAVAWAVARPSALVATQDVQEAIANQERGLARANEPDPRVIGPFKPTKGVNGLILRRGYIVAEWGDTREVDMTASLTKSIVSTVAGLAFDRGLLLDVHERVGVRVRDGGFDSPQNTPITWEHLLQQTSEWEGTLWGKPDLNDRRTRRNGEPLRSPGTFWDYNDVRVNRLALSLLMLFRRPLPEVLREHLIRPIGASDTWEWHGYHNSWIELDGRRVQSVSGGSHWGGGFWVSSRDLARLGLLYLRRGEWDGRRLLSERWIGLATTPAKLNGHYGYLWWLNADGFLSPNLSRKIFTMAGGGGFFCAVLPEEDLVVVVKALDGGLRQFAAFLEQVAGAVVTR